MNLKDYLSGKGKLQKGKTTDWLPFCKLDVTSGSLWAGDPHVANAEDGCVVKVARGTYAVEAIVQRIDRHRVVSRLRVRRETAANPTLGKEVGQTGTDTAMIGVCDMKAFSAACAHKDADAVQDAIESQTKDGFGIISVNKRSGPVMAFLPTGSDGTGPVVALLSSGRCVGIQLSFMEETDVAQASDTDRARVSLLGQDTETFKTWALAGGGEASCWVGGKLKAGAKISIWSDPPQGPVAYRIRHGKGRVAKGWTVMGRKRGGGPEFGAVEVLRAGRYEIDFRIGEEIFSAITLVLE